jgi:hypothetical protein
MRGGNRPGAGRKPGSVSAARTRLQQTARDVAAQVLSEVDAVSDLEKINPAAGSASVTERSSPAKAVPSLNSLLHLLTP